MNGSSPHTRGAPGFGSSWRRVRGIIPAYAGSTCEGSWRCRATADHPRIRGEHLYFDRPQTRNCGSSPHTRGAHFISTSPRLEIGIIPAYAGSTIAPARRRSTGCGSSPHTRGAPPEGTRNSVRAPDHPRIRGEHRSCRWRTRVLAGSSPHTRGAPLAQNLRNAYKRIIPAYAGSTRRRLQCILRRPDHPRIRGEHSRNCDRPRASVGSSPHTRGAHAPPQAAFADDGIIPAYAGSTRPTPSGLRRRRDHPRIRGEHAAHGPEIRGRRGSSPHTRGARDETHRGV